MLTTTRVNWFEPRVELVVAAVPSRAKLVAADEAETLTAAETRCPCGRVGLRAEAWRSGGERVVLFSCPACDRATLV